MEEKNITEQESLAIIQQMIAKSKQQLIDRSKFFFLWGFAVLICAVAQYVMLKMNVLKSDEVWLAMPIIAIIHIYIAAKEQKRVKIISHNTIAIGSLWMGLGVAFFALAFLSHRSYVNTGTALDVLPLLILFYGIGTFVTGRILQFKPLIFGGLACFLLCILVTYIDGPEQLLILALSVVVSYIIPGIILKKEFNNQQNN
ncbi:MAG: hypothetical protein IPP60_11710 [Sphingobacteriales bacterium]|nr:hypothetical protein [Sphingobacteriales bacterium]